MMRIRDWWIISKTAKWAVKKVQVARWEIRWDDWIIS
jgi:hypothetical protein